MLELIQKHKAAFAGFIEQKELGVLLVRCAGDQTGYAIQILRSVETDGSPDVFLAFVQDFESAAQYASLVVERVRASEKAAREELGKRGLKLPTIPSLCLDEKREPMLRLKAALLYAKSLLPNGGGQRLVCAFLPLQIKDAAGYGQLMSSLAEPQGMPPWYRGMRFFLREDSKRPMFGATIPPLTKIYETDFSQETISAGLRAEATDSTLPADRQVLALFQLAALDFGNNRPDDARAKYLTALAHYQQTGDATMQALCVSGLGDIEQRKGDLPAAVDLYARAIPAASESKALVVLFALARNLGNLNFQLKNYGEAEKYFDSAQQLALHVYDADTKVLALEHRALCEMQRSALKPARKSLTEALEVARQFKKTDHESRILGRLSQLAGVN